LSNIKDAIRLHLEDRQADHDELAEPKSFSLSTVEVSMQCLGHPPRIPLDRSIVY
jgi:hypothetical protein